MGTEAWFRSRSRWKTTSRGVASVESSQATNPWATVLLLFAPINLRSVHRTLSFTQMHLTPTLKNYKVICGDTSFSDPTAADNRGCAVSDITIEGVNTSTSFTRVSGVLCNRREYEYSLPPTAPEAEGISCAWGPGGDPWVGHEVPLRPGWWVRAKLKSENGNVLYHAVKGEGSPPGFFSFLSSAWSRFFR